MFGLRSADLRKQLFYKLVYKLTIRSCPPSSSDRRVTLVPSTRTLSSERDELIALYTKGIEYRDLWRIMATIRPDTRHSDWHSSNQHSYFLFEKAEKARGEIAVVTQERVDRALEEFRKQSR